MKIMKSVEFCTGMIRFHQDDFEGIEFELFWFQ